MMHQIRHVAVYALIGWVGLSLLSGCAPPDPADGTGRTGPLLAVFLGMMGIFYLLNVLLVLQDARRRAKEHSEGEVSPLETFLGIPEYDGDGPPHLFSLTVLFRTSAVKGYDERGWRGVFGALGQCTLLFGLMMALGFALKFIVVWLAS